MCFQSPNQQQHKLSQLRQQLFELSEENSLATLI